jgi:hypothetical protein
VVGITASLLARPRVTAFVAVSAGVVAWFLVAPHLGRVGLWTAIVLAAVVVMPVTFVPIFIALPLWSKRWLLPMVVAFALVALLSSLAGWELVANFAKLIAAVLAGWVFLTLFERLSWVVLVACVIPVVDIISVYAGPTKIIVNDHFGVYRAFAIAFLLPGGGAMYLGPPDILFYGLFLAAAARWHLRVGWTWLAMTFMYSFTFVFANAIDVNGLPALPFLSFGFLAANADLLWRAIRPSEGSSESSPASS